MRHEARAGPEEDNGEIDRIRIATDKNIIISAISGIYRLVLIGS